MMESHQAEAAQSYITVIPVEYPRSRVYPHPPEYIVDQYSDYVRERTREDYARGDYTISSEPQFEEVGPLYTVSQRFERDKSYGHDTDREREWERPLHSLVSSSDTSHQPTKDGTTELHTDDQRPAQVSPSQPLKVCVYMMSRVVVNMELEDGANCTVQDLVMAILQDDDLGLSRVAANIFTLWMCSGLLELQLKPHHKPFEIRCKWSKLVSQYGTGSESRKARDEPVLSFQRNIFFSKRDEEKIKEQRGKFLPVHVSRSQWSWLHISGKNSPEVRLLEQFKRIPTSTPVRKLIRKYLEFCWSLPFYGAAFFQGQIEQPVRGLTSLVTHQDMPVLVAINSQGVYIIDDIQCVGCILVEQSENHTHIAPPITCFFKCNLADTILAVAMHSLKGVRSSLY